jgi:hypothetical protein
LFIIMQQVQPACIMAFMQSQHAWIIWQHFASPELHDTLQPLSVISQTHMPMVRLQQQTVMPFIIMQQLTMPPDSIEQRFCNVLQATASSQLHVIDMPSLVFSMRMVQRGTIIMLGGIIGPVAVVCAMPAPIMPMPVPAIPMPGRSIMLLFAIRQAPFRDEMDASSS